MDSHHLPVKVKRGLLGPLRKKQTHSSLFGILGSSHLQEEPPVLAFGASSFPEYQMTPGPAVRWILGSLVICFHTWAFPF